MLACKMTNVSELVEQLIMPAGGKSRVLACKMTNVSELVENPTKDASVMVVYQHPLNFYNRNNYIVYFCSMYFNQKSVIVYQDPSTAVELSNLHDWIM